MADVTITSVTYASGGTYKQVTLGEAGSAGDCVYQKAADSKYWLADSTSVATALCEGILLTAGEADGPAIMATPGSGTVLKLGTLVAAERYYVSSNSGKLQPSTDLITGEFVTLVGVADSTTELKMGIVSSAIAVP